MHSTPRSQLRTRTNTFTPNPALLHRGQSFSEDVLVCINQNQAARKLLGKDVCAHHRLGSPLSQAFRILSRIGCVCAAHVLCTVGRQHEQEQEKEILPTSIVSQIRTRGKRLLWQRLTV